MFNISSEVIDRESLITSLLEDKAGAIATFEGWVRNHNEGKPVKSLEYQVYHELALKEGNKILNEAKEKFNLHGIRSVHREGHLQVGEMAVWVGATASHRDDAFKATRFVIDEIKHRLPVWKKEHYLKDPSEWVFCKHHHHHVHFSEEDYYKKQKTVVNQTLLKDSKVIVIGAGGLGCNTLLGLVSAGIGQLTIVDHDTIDISNIHRQPLYTPNLVGEKKVWVANAKLRELNPFISINAIDTYVDEQNILNLLKDHQIVIDCTDNLLTKYLIHDACLFLNIPLITASIFKYEGQLRTVIKGTGCLRCINSSTPHDSLLGNCNDFGVLGTATQILGSLQALEAIKLISTGSNSSTDHALYFDLQSLTQMSIKVSVAKDCKFCQGSIVLNKNEVEIGRSEVGSDVEIVDIRQMTDDEVEKFKNYSKKVALCCHRGIRSHTLARKFRNEGHDHFYSLKGGACSL